MPLVGRLPSSPRLRRRRPQPHRATGVRRRAAITAALFLREFVGRAPVGAPRHRRHGPVGRRRAECSAKGATGFGDPTAAAVAGGDGMNAGYGLTVRWSLEDAARDAADAAARVRRRHVDRAVHVPRRPGLQGLADARGRVVRGHLRLRHEQDRTIFREGFEPGAASGPGSAIIGSAPVAHRGLGGRGDRRGPGGLPPRRRPRHVSLTRRGSRSPRSRRGGSALDGDEQAVADRQQRREQARRGRAASCRGRAGCVVVRVAGRRVGDLVVPEHVVEHEDARRSAAAGRRARRTSG